MRILKKIFKKIIGKKIIEGIYSNVRRIKGIYYSVGNNVECPICNHTYKKFLTFGGRENVWCPNCKSLERHRLIYLFLKHKMNFFTSNIKVLHFAAEECLYNMIMNFKNIDYTTADSMASLMDEIGVKPDYIMSVTDIKFDDESFGVVLCNHVLEHVPDDKKAMKEIYRVLKTGGYGILQVPINKNSPITIEGVELSSEKRAALFGYADHVRYYGLDYKDRLEKVGFKVVLDNLASELNSTRYALCKNEIIYISYKQ